MNLPHQVLGVDFGVDIVATNDEVGIGDIETNTQNRGVGQCDGINIGITFAHSPVAERGSQGIVEIVGDGMPVFVVDNIGDHGQGIATGGLGVEVDAVTVEKRIAIAIGSFDFGGKGNVQGRKIGKITLHVIVDPVGMVIGAQVRHLVPKCCGTAPAKVLNRISLRVNQKAEGRRCSSVVALNHFGETAFERKSSGDR